MLWSSGICLHLDAKHFIHKINPTDQEKAPKSLIWRRKNEDLTKAFTSKGVKQYGAKVAGYFIFRFYFTWQRDLLL